MKRRRPGFTIIEVSIFLAISGLLFLAVTLGVQNSINQQRRNDSVQSFMEFLRGVYSGVTNVQNKAYGEGSGISGGRSDSAIYGKAVFFNGNNEVTVKTVIAGADLGDGANGETLTLLKGLKWRFSGNDESRLNDRYTMRWGARIDNKGTLMILRNPVTGSINTYWRNNIVTESLDDISKFKKQELDICVNTGINPKSDVRIAADAKNASGIALYTDEGNKCK